MPSGPADTSYRSRFGGFWTDRVDVEARLAGRVERAEITTEELGYVRHWIEHGFVVIEGAVDSEAIDRLHEDVAGAWTSGNPQLWVDFIGAEDRELEPVDPCHEHMQVKLLDAYAWSEAARDIVFSPSILRFLRILFETEPMAFQSLYFERGTQQPMHQDTSFVWVRRPMEFVGSWVAMEDIVPHSGELEYYAGSHRIEPHAFDDGSRRMPEGYDAMPEHTEMLHSRAAEMGLARIKFRPKKGDVVLWHADLVHGGSADWDPATTRRSLVTHYCPMDNPPAYFDVQPHSGRKRHPTGGYWCFPVRGAASALGRWRLKAVRFGKQTLHKLRSG